MAALMDLEVEQMDVKAIFLLGDLEEEIYVEQPKGFRALDQEDLSEIPTESNDFHIVEISSLLTDSNCSHSATVSSKEEGLKLFHKYGPCSPSKHGKANAPSVRQILEGDQTRLNFKQQSKLYGENTVKVKLDSSNTFEYAVNVGLGTPKKELTLVMDTGSSLIWTQCQPCKLGSYHGCYKQADPIFDPSKSSTYINVTCPSHTCSLTNTTLGFTTCSSTSTCEYAEAYLDGSSLAGYLAKERLSVGSDTFDDTIFGCAEFNANVSVAGTDGILGMDRGFLSFVEQTSSTYQRVFSYCLPSKASEIGFLKFGKAKPVSKSLKFTQLGASYSINIVGIKLGNTKLPIAFQKGTASIDSGTVITRLPTKDYITLREAYRKAMSHYQLAKPFVILDTCYHVGSLLKLKIPKMSFLFADGLVLDLPPIGLAFPINSNLVCLPFAPYPGGVDRVLFGNFQQKTLEIVYDVAGGKFGFGYGGCK
ncbi:aspartyl protease family protein At5g10770-like [Gastrolobium bilobum]|uniref:aspartyl protease family protein At5g10770-like n=1 Tax=Gastrolobium bilobum TaxID=150636 RepID=UPI002AB0FB62|nr:aspartyl protease family protein At5g10770-like [Gastrolobium bilobum]